MGGGTLGPASGEQFMEGRFGDEGEGGGDAGIREDQSHR
jgi:hypothetical protein